MELLDGKAIAQIIKNEIDMEVKKLASGGRRSPHIAIILVGHDGASETYVKYKIRDCEQVGFRSTLIRYEEDVSESELVDKVEEINKNSDIDGVIVQLPLPEHIHERRIVEAIDYRKDVDGFHPMNTGRTVLGLPSFVSATPAGIVELIRRYDISTEGKNCVILGRSNIVGRPLSILLSRKTAQGNATVTLCHSRTPDIAGHTRNADIVVAAMGNPGFLTAAMVKEGAVVIDVGTTRIRSGQTKSGWKLAGDVMFDEVAPQCSYITPVPGGVGPMTRVSLLKNTLLAAKAEIYPQLSG